VEGSGGGGEGVCRLRIPLEAAQSGTGGTSYQAANRRVLKEVGGGGMNKSWGGSFITGGEDADRRQTTSEGNSPNGRSRESPG